MRARPRLIAPALIGAALATACTVGPNFERPAAPAVDHYLPAADPSETAAGDGRAQRFIPGARVETDWWRRFQAPDLDRLVEEALRGNQTVAAAVATLAQSENELRAGYGVFFPQIDLDANGTRQRFSPARFGQSFPGSIFNLFTASGSVGYVLDVFGGERRQVEALRSGVDLQRTQLNAAQLSITANIVNTVVARAAYREEAAATQALIDAADAQVELTQVRVRSGTASAGALATLRAQVATLRASLPPLEQRVDQAEDLLATLVGRTPAEWRTPPLALADLELPRELPLSLPSELVRRRPDVLAAEARLHAASAEVGVATAALFPSVSLSGDWGGNAARLRDLGGTSARFWSAGADVSLPIFHGGSLWYGRKAAADAYRAALAAYRQTVLSAFQQVADTLHALQHDADLVRAQSGAAHESQVALELARVNYRAGLVDYLAVLTATSQFQTAEIGHVSAVGQRLQDSVALFVALGGGWSEDSAAAAPAAAPAVAPRAAR